MTFEQVVAMALTLPDVETGTKYDGSPVLKAGGVFLAGMASHASAEPGTLVVRHEIGDRDVMIEDAPDTYYLTDYYRPYPLVLARLTQLHPDALQDLLRVSWRMAMAKTKKGRRAALP
jgi:hypothetical protein